jgi:hypothetical protein
MDSDSELDRLDPEPLTHKLTTGFAVEVQRLKTRQLFRFLKILTHGAGPALMQSSLNFDEGEEVFGQRLFALMVVSIPDAETDAIAFLSSMCEPLGITKRKPGKAFTKQETEDNRVLFEQFSEEFFNPDIDDTIDLIEIIVKREAPEIQALGKRLAGLMELVKKTGQDKGKPGPEASPEELSGVSPEHSPTRSTSSVTSTGGPTSTSETSPSAGSDSASKRRRAESSKSG